VTSCWLLLSIGSAGSIACRSRSNGSPTTVAATSLVIDTVVCLTLDKWETVSGQFGGYLNPPGVSTVSVTKLSEQFCTDG
jgi:hypothetical protein